jgi:hypothetical protein
MIIKIEMENAFTKVHHNFLFEVLHANLASIHLSLKWIEACISIPWITPLINGCPTNFFKASKGLSRVVRFPLFYIS